jgi:hypothetical protein
MHKVRCEKHGWNGVDEGCPYCKLAAAEAEVERLKRENNDLVVRSGRIVQCDRDHKLKAWNDALEATAPRRED